MPPEVNHGNVHRTVSGMDIWTVGRLLKQLISIYKYNNNNNDKKISLSSNGNQTKKNDDNEDDSTILYSQILNLRDLMMKEDPYE